MSTKRYCDYQNFFWHVHISYPLARHSIQIFRRHKKARLTTSKHMNTYDRMEWTQDSCSQ